MDDEPERLEIDSRVRAALRTDADASRRAVARALADNRGMPNRQWRRRFATAAALALLLVLAGFEWRRSAGRATSPSLTVTSAGSVLVVETQDGRRWIVGPSPPRRSGNYVIVVRE